MTARRAFPAMVVVGAAALLAMACGSGSGNPSSPSGAMGVRVQGTVLGAAAATGVTAQNNGPATSGPIVVTVKGMPSLSVTVSGNGTFELDNLPQGTFTLVFTRNGVTLGQVTVNGANAAATVKIVVQVNGATITLVNMEMDEPEASASPSPSPSPKPSPSASPGMCLIDDDAIVGRGIEVEGSVASAASPAAFTVNFEGERARGAVAVNASSASFVCVGDSRTSDCKSQLKAGVEVHVQGTLAACSATSATVTASQVKIQNEEHGD